MRRVTSALDLRDLSDWNDAERDALRAIAPLLAQIAGLSDWPLRDKARLTALIRANGGDEYRYFALVAGFARFRRSLDSIAARAASPLTPLFVQNPPRTEKS